MKTATVRFLRDGLPEKHEITVPESVITSDKNMLNLNVFRHMFDAEFYDEIGVSDFYAKIDNGEQ